MVSVNPLYADALAKQLAPPKVTADFEKDVPSFKFFDIGDGIRGTIYKVGEPFQSEETFKGQTRTVTKQVISLKDVKIKREDGTQESHPKMNVWLQKNGQYASIAVALGSIEGRSDLLEGDDFIHKWTGLGKAVGEGSRPHKFETKVTPA